MTSQQRFILFAALAAIVVAAAVFFIYPVSKSMKLGLDLQGGVSVLMQGKGTKQAPLTGSSMDQAEQIIRNRVDKLGVAEPSIQRQGSDYILVQLPGVKDQQKAIDIIGQTALLEFRPVLYGADGKALVEPANGEDTLKLGPITKNPQSNQEIVAEDKAGELKYKLGPAALTGNALSNAQVGFDQYGAARVNIEFTSDGSKKFDELAAKYYQKQFAIVLDDKVQSAPTINATKFGGKAEITGKFTTQEAKDLALVLQTGALPVKLDMVEVRTVGATLGLDALRAGLTAGIVGLLLVAIYMIVFYRGLGVITVSALVVFGTILFGVIAFLGKFGNSFGLYYTMTLPGIAGIILSIGVAADSSIIIFERVKEEIADGKSLRVAASSGFKNGFKTMVDADVVTFITATVIYIFAIGPVRGFAFTLMIGVIADLFTCFFFTQSALQLVANWRAIQKPALLGIKEVG